MARKTEKIVNPKRDYYLRNRERILAKVNAYRIENKEKIRERRAQAYRANIEEERAKSRRRYHENKEKRKAQQRDYYWANREILLIKGRERQEKNRDRYNANQRAAEKIRRAEVKKAIFDAYGRVCSCPGGCQESREEFLTIDHINNDGAEHRAKVGPVYEWLYRNNFPPGFRTLCMNCNFAIGIYGYCPHEKRNG